MAEKSAKEILTQARKGLEGIYESTLRIFEVPYDPETKKPIPREKPLTPEEHDEVVNRVQKRVQKLRKRTKEIQAELNMSHNDLMTFIENPNNFTTEQWEVLQEMRAQLQAYRGQVVQAIEGKPEKANAEAQKKASGYKKKMKKGKWIQG